jgi:uncharacterized RDD family membrane protein YckC
MTCPVCGKAHPCAHSRKNSSVLADPQIAGKAELFSSGPAAGPSSLGAGESEPEQAGGQAWRQEVASRVRQHRARRRANADPNALELDFTAEEPYSFAAEQHESTLPPPPQRFAEIIVRAGAKKVIRFPRPTAAPLPAVEEVRLEELGESVPAPARVMDAPLPAEPSADGLLAEPQASAMVEAEQMELLPSFADIHLEPEARRLDDDVELIPHPAPLGLRAVAGLVDAGIVFIASGAFALTFLQLAEEMPHSRLTPVFVLAAAGIFWLAYQYLFLVHGRRTPGMRLAGVELRTFAGGAPSPFARRCRALASTLAALAAGLGYLWAFIDEDRVGWHDRISQTYLRSLPIPSIAREPYGDDAQEAQRRLGQHAANKSGFEYKQ